MPNVRGRHPRRLSPEERKSLTHGDFWIPEDEREVYRRALQNALWDIEDGEHALDPTEIVIAAAVTRG